MLIPCIARLYTIMLIPCIARLYTIMLIPCIARLYTIMLIPCIARLYTIMLIPCIARLYTITNAVHWVISFILICRLLHVSAHVCHPQAAFNVLVSYM